MSFGFPADGYTQGRFDRMAVDVAITRSKVESIEKNLAAIDDRYQRQEERVVRLERKMFALWLIGPLALGVAALLGNLRGWFFGR